MYLPGLLVLCADPGERATALVLTVYLVYVLVSLLRSHAEYQQRLDLDQELRDQRDLFALIHLDALVKAGQLAGAQNLLQPQLRAQPESKRLKRQAARLYAALGLPSLAAELAPPA